MSIHPMWSGVLVVGASLFGMACGPTADAEQESHLQEDQAAGAFSGDFAGIPCAGGQKQEKKKKPACTGREHGHRYVSRDPVQCLAITFICEDGFTPFFNDCGCGCKRQKQACKYNDPNRTFVSRDPNQCAAIRFICEPGKVPFFDDCGCGCEPAR
jgi:hypothetical protein